MNVKKAAVSSLLAAALVIGAGAALAQDDSTTTPGNGPSVQQPFNGPRQFGPGNQQFGPGNQRQFGGPRNFGQQELRPGIGIRLEIADMAEQYTGLTIAQLREAHQNGQTLAELITANGKTVDDFIAAVLEQPFARIDQAVTNGRLTSERADQLKSALTDRVTARVNGEAPMGPQGPQGPQAPATDSSNTL